MFSSRFADAWRKAHWIAAGSPIDQVLHRRTTTRVCEEARARRGAVFLTTVLLVVARSSNHS